MKPKYVELFKFWFNKKFAYVEFESLAPDNCNIFTYLEHLTAEEVGQLMGGN
jgi:hypothetical protein